MADLTPKPLEINDWSGGITENYLQADPRRSQIIDNYYINIDKKLDERPPFRPYSSSTCQLGSNNGRVNGMFTFINETILMAAQGRTMYYLPFGEAAAFTPIVGIGGNEAVQGGDPNCQITYGEFQHQIYLTSDGTPSVEGALPSKIYRDVNNNWTAVTAGLPRLYSAPNYSISTLLTSCINLANQLAQSMISHFNDALNSIYVGNQLTQFTTAQNLHYNLDRYSLAYLVPQTFTSNDPEGTNPATAISVATNQATLFQLTYALSQAFQHHMNDALIGVASPQTTLPSGFTAGACLYHNPTRTTQLDGNNSYFGVPFRGPHVALTNVSLPVVQSPVTTPANILAALTTCAAQLDDLYQKWNWHRKAVWTHSIYNDPAFFDKYAPTLPKIGLVQTSQAVPTITPDFGDCYNYVNNLKFLFNQHVGDKNTSMHATPTDYYWAFDQTVRLPDCTDQDSMYLLTYWLRSMYQLHWLDESVAVHTGITFAATAGSAGITSVTQTSTSSAITLPVGAMVAIEPVLGATFHPYNNQSIYIAKVISSGSGTATLDRQFSGTNGSYAAQWTFAVQHMSWNPSTLVFTDSTTSIAQATDELSSSVLTYGQDMKSWLLLAQDFWTAFMSHALYENAHVPGGLNPYFTGKPASTNIEAYQEIQVNTKVPFFIPTVSTNAYAFFFSHQYTVEPNGVQYLVAGNPVLSASQTDAVSLPLGATIATQVAAYYPSSQVLLTRTNVVSGLPVLANDGSTNYDLANIMLNIYKTIDGGETFYLVGQVPNGTTTFVDSISDTLEVNGQAPLPTGQEMYTTGGDVGSDQPPQSSYVHILNGTAYFGAITDAGQYFPNRIRQAVQLAPDWCPASFNDDLDDALTGISSTRSNVIAFCENSIYRMIGGFSQQGQGTLTHERISDTTGALNAKSIVRTEIGVFFAGSDGFYYTDGYQIIKVTIDLDDTYAALTSSEIQKRAIYGAYDKDTRRVHWSMRANSTDAENSIVYVFYLNYGVKPSGTFTTLSNGAIFQPSSMVFQQGVHIMGHGLGYVLRADPWNKSDVVPVIGVSPNAWNTVAIPYNWTSAAIDMGTTFQRKWTTKLHMGGHNIGNQAIQAYAIKDLNATGLGPRPFSPILYGDNRRWGQPIDVWGDASVKWKTDGKMDVWRWWPQKVIRSDFMQVSVQPSNQVCYSSSVGYPVGANAVVNSVAKTAVIQTPGGYSSILWPPDVVNYEISFSYTGYTVSFLITALSTDMKTITFADPNNLTIAAPLGTPWQISGVRKAQRSNLTFVQINYALTGDNNTAFGGATSAGNVGNLGGNPS